jgi:hypothetical protein
MTPQNDREKQNSGVKTFEEEKRLQSRHNREILKQEVGTGTKKQEKFSPGEHPDYNAEDFNTD